MAVTRRVGTRPKMKLAGALAVSLPDPPPIGEGEWERAPGATFTGKPLPPGPGLPGGLRLNQRYSVLTPLRLDRCQTIINGIHIISHSDLATIG